MLKVISSPDDELEHQIDEAYQRMCAAQTKQAATQAMNDMHELMAKRSPRKVSQLEHERMTRIRNGG